MGHGKAHHFDNGEPLNHNVLATWHGHPPKRPYLQLLISYKYFPNKNPAQFSKRTSIIHLPSSSIPRVPQSFLSETPIRSYPNGYCQSLHVGCSKGLSLGLCRHGGDSFLSQCLGFRICGFPKIRGAILGVPIMRTIVFGGLYRVPLTLGSYHLELARICKHKQVGCWGSSYNRCTSQEESKSSNFIHSSSQERNAI